MLLSSLVASLLLAAAPALAQDIVYNAEHNATSIAGTWSTGSRAVSTGSGFANPANKSFTYPKNTGVSYSFTDDGFYEVARYRFNGNGSEPTCIVGVMQWHHGTFTFNANGSMTLTPFGDGYQQIQNACGAVSNFIEDYNMTESLMQWRIFMDPTDGPKLHLWQGDGTPIAPQFQLAASPVMLPTRKLRNDTTEVLSRRSLQKRSGGERAWTPSGVVGLLASVAAMGMASFVL